MGIKLPAELRASTQAWGALAQGGRANRHWKFDADRSGCYDRSAGWSSLVARWAHNPKVGGSNPPPATNAIIELRGVWIFDCGLKWSNKIKNTRAKAVHVTAFCYLVRS